MQHSLVFTFISDDRPGIVERISSTVASHGGNWLESRMTKLAGKFAGIVQVSIPDEQRKDLEEALQQLSAEGLSILSGEVTPDKGTAAHEMVRLSIIGLDRPGIVREISQLLAEKKINVAEMHSVIESAPMTGEPLFRADIDIQKPLSLSLETLRDLFDAIGNRLDLDWNLEKR
jgi:glycine cleavage system regulatory protein